MGFLRSGALALVLVSVACAARTTGDGAQSAGTLPCDVERVLAAQCRTCHADPPLYGAPMPLVSHADLHARARSTPDKAVFEMVALRTHDSARPMPEPPRPRLSAADQKVLDDWIASGAPAGTSSCGALPDGGVDAAPPPDLPPGCPNVTLRAASPYVMGASTEDQYVCFGVDVTVPKKRHIVRFDPKIENAVIAHHAVVYVSASSESATPHVCSPAGAFGRRMVYGWAPGGVPFDLPPEAGLPLEGTTHFVVQMHYSNLRHLAGQTDQSSIELCATDALRPNDADVLALGSDRFSIPARSTYGIECTLDVPPNFSTLHFFGSMPHMHQIGRTIGSSVTHGGTPVTIDEVTSWSFGAQPWHAVDATVAPGDRVRTWCSWTNGTDATVSYGERTSDEMCYHFLMYYPRITTSAWSWETPIGLESCAPAK